MPPRGYQTWVKIAALGTRGLHPTRDAGDRRIFALSLLPTAALGCGSFMGHRFRLKRRGCVFKRGVIYLQFRKPNKTHKTCHRAR